MSPRRPWVYALIYMSISMGLEIFLMVVCRLKIPEDNKFIAPVLLSVAPVAAALLARYRSPRELVSVILLSSVLTLLFVMIYSGITGSAIGLLEPFIVRTSAGFVAAVLTAKWVAKR